MSAVTSLQAHKWAIESIDKSIDLMQSQLQLLVDQFKQSLDNTVKCPELGVASLCGTTYPNIIQLASRIAELKDRREYHKLQIIKVTYVPMVDDDGRPYHKVGG